MNMKYAWEPSYQAVVLETDDGKLPKLIEETRSALNLRLQELSNGAGPEERLAVEQALRALKVLLQERCQAADFNKS